MDRALLTSQQEWVRAELDRCINFWLQNSQDKVNGGVYTCLDKQGHIYCTDKSVWMQGRCAWMFSYLCRVYGVKQEWLDFAKSCLDFAEKYCVDHARGRRMYYVVTADGHPIRQRRRFHSEGFYCIGNAEYYGVTGDKTYLDRALKAYELYWQLYHKEFPDPFAPDAMTQPDTRPGHGEGTILRTLDLPMIYLNISSIMRRCHPEGAELYNARARQCVEEIFRYHRKKDMHCTLETVGQNGEFMDTPAGRQVNAGHDIECSWFLMEYANELENAELHQEALCMFDDAAKAGWDERFGGLYNFVDCLDKPIKMPWHSAKIWWLQTEILIASMMAYRDTRDERYHAWFTKALDYCRQHMSDTEYGEWIDGLRRDNTPTPGNFSTKGNTNKGPFHVPRALCMVDQMLTQVLAE